MWTTGQSVCPYCSTLTIFQTHWVWSIRCQETCDCIQGIAYMSEIHALLFHCFSGLKIHTYGWRSRKGTANCTFQICRGIVVFIIYFCILLLAASDQIKKWEMYICTYGFFSCFMRYTYIEAWKTSPYSWKIRKEGRRRKTVRCEGACVLYSSLFCVFPPVCLPVGGREYPVWHRCAGQAPWARWQAGMDSSCPGHWWTPPSSAEVLVIFM